LNHRGEPGGEGNAEGKGRGHESTSVSCDGGLRGWVFLANVRSAGV